MSPVSNNLQMIYHHTVKKIGDDIEDLKFNTAISQMMIFVNEVMKSDARPRQILESFVLLLSPFAPHIAEELWRRLGHDATLAYEPWPGYDPAMLRRSTVEIVVQVNGKVRSRLDVPADTPEKRLEELALADADVLRHTEGKKVLKVIVVKNKLVNLVVK
ncbi:MAG TPA: class I tRNA ligase family protein [Bacteroidota bacterium]